MKKKIILYGPPVGLNLKKAYGGGSGGYTRNMQVYLDEFVYDDIQIIPLFHSIDGQFNLSIFTLPFRLLYDFCTIFYNLLKIKPDGIHCLAQYRRAFPREFMLVFLAFIFRIPVLYEVKAGAFMDAYESGGKLYKRGIDFIIKHSKIILVEGKVYIHYIQEKFNKNSYYFPNIVKDSEVKNNINEKLQKDSISILFVGYCYRGKGVFELVKACDLAYKQGVNVELTFIGAEHEDFKKYLDDNKFSFNIKRLGKQNHNVVLQELEKNDVYCYLSDHSGEGHNNTINEAMMMGMIIICTPKGFLENILSNETAYFVRKNIVEETAQTLLQIKENRQEALSKSRKARAYLEANFTSTIAREKLHHYYRELIQ